MASLIDKALKFNRSGYGKTQHLKGVGKLGLSVHTPNARNSVDLNLQSNASRALTLAAQAQKNLKTGKINASITAQGGKAQAKIYKKPQGIGAKVNYGQTTLSADTRGGFGMQRKVNKNTTFKVGKDNNRGAYVGVTFKRNLP
tara:strand:+ start:102 stop:530 length:429 start_codon:yes stop_codon:yes gene_type:complete